MAFSHSSCERTCARQGCASQSTLFCALCTLHQKLSMIRTAQCREEMDPFLLKCPFLPCQGGSGKSLQGLWWRSGCSWPRAVSPAVLKGAATSMTMLGRFCRAREGQWVDRELSVTPRAPLLSHGVRGSMACCCRSCRGVHGQSCSWVNFQAGEQCPGQPWSSSGGFWEENAPVLAHCSEPCHSSLRLFGHSL